MTLRTDKRFYETVAIGREDGGFTVLLGGRPLRTPEKSILRLPTAAFAAGVADEWLAQGETLRPETMRLTRLAATAAEHAGARRRAVVDAVAAYAGSDLLCYRADSPDELVALQRSAWQPLLDWAAERWGAHLVVGAGVVPIAQPAAAIDALSRAVDQANDLELAALSCVVQASASIVVGLAVVEGHIDAETACAAALLDERYQAAHWGIDAEADGRRRDIADDIRAAACFLELAGPGGVRTPSRSTPARVADERSAE